MISHMGHVPRFRQEDKCADNTLYKFKILLYTGKLSMPTLPSSDAVAKQHLLSELCSPFCHRLRSPHQVVEWHHAKLCRPTSAKWDIVNITSIPDI
jgi:hypothetical protein